MPIIRQAEAAECGIACLAMISNAHGYKIDLTSLRSRFPVSMRGATLKDIIAVASQMNLAGRPVRCELEELIKLRTPAILHWNMNHFVVLKSASKKRLVIYDPARGKITCSMADAARHFTGVALELSPGPSFQRKTEKNPVKLASLIKIDGQGWKAISQGLALSIFLQVFVLLGPYYMQLVIDEAILKGDLSLLTAIACGFALLKVFEALTTVIRGLVFQFLANVVAFDMEASLFRHMLRLPLSFFHRRHIGDIQQRFGSLAPIRDLIVNGAIAALVDGALSIFLGIIIFLYDQTLGFIVVGFVLFYGVLRFAFLEISKRLSGDFLVADANENTKFLESLRAMQTLKVAGIEDARETLWRNLAIDTVNAQIRMGNVNIGYKAISQTLMSLSNILVVFLAASNTIGGTMTIGMITAFVAYKSQFEQKLLALLEFYVQFKLLDVHLQRVSDIALARPERSSDTQPMAGNLSGHLQLRNVYFRYAPHEPTILAGANLTVEPGEFVALAAPSGTGKSTLLRLITGLYEPSNGAVLYDGVEAGRWGLTNLRQMMGVVLQDDVLLAGTILENISLFDEKPDIERAVTAGRIACIHDEIEAMPMGYRSLVGDMGSSLSGGQQQRIVLARALYRQPRILVMDEATSQIDVETERKINSELQRLDITRVVAAHRTETIAAADRVCTIVNGRIRTVAQNKEQQERSAFLAKVTGRFDLGNGNLRDRSEFVCNPPKILDK